MIIFGTKSTNKVLDRGTFLCPNCESETSFEKRRAKSWFHLYFIPLIPLKTYPNFVECRSCAATFVEGVLNSSNHANSNGIRAEFEKASLAILVRMAWADGKIERDEVEAIHSVVNHMSTHEYSYEDIESEISAAENSHEDALSVAKNVGNMINDSGREIILQAVFHVAVSDGEFAEQEQDLIWQIGDGLGMTPAHVRGVLSELLEPAADFAQAN